MTQPRLVIMTKEPRPGRVKSRLATDIGTVRASTWVRHRLTHMARALTHPKWTTILAVAPDTALRSALLPDLPRIAQGSGNLGARMAHVIHALPPAPTLIIGSDIPGITPAMVQAAFQTLARHKSVIGPASDGGYWAVGLDTRRAIPRALFTDVRWSTSHALADTLRTLPPPAYLPRLDDVDTAMDLRRLSR